MNEQPELVAVETKAYMADGLMYIVHGIRLFQVDHNHFFEFMPGNEVYGNRMRVLKKMQPIAHSEVVSKLSELLKTIEEIL